MASASDKRRALAALAADRDGQGRAARILRRAVAALVILLGASLSCLWMLGFFSTPRAIAEVRQLVDHAVGEYERVARGDVPYASAPGSSELWERLRELPPDYRRQMGEDMWRLAAARERAELGSYFALPPEQRQEELDRRLKAEADRRAKWQAERTKRDRERAARGEPSGAGGGASGSIPAAGQASSGAAAGGAVGQRGGGSDEARLQRSKQRLDRTHPTERAQQAEYRRAMEARRTQLGLPPGGGGRRGG